MNYAIQVQEDGSFSVVITFPNAPEVAPISITGFATHEQAQYYIQMSIINLAKAYTKAS